jgi:fructosamine-3-kinase
VDPAVSYNWPEVDLSMLYHCPRPPASDRFFDAYEEVAVVADGWRERTTIFILREWLATIAHGDDTWGAVDSVRKVVAPFRSRSGN